MAEDLQRWHDLLKLPPAERLRLARWLIESTVRQTNSSPLAEATTPEQVADTNGLLALAGRCAGGPGDTAERAEEILEAEVDPAHGLSVR